MVSTQNKNSQKIQNMLKVSFIHLVFNLEVKGWHSPKILKTEPPVRQLARNDLGYVVPRYVHNSIYLSVTWLLMLLLLESPGHQHPGSLPSISKDFFCVSNFNTEKYMSNANIHLISLEFNRQRVSKAGIEHVVNIYFLFFRVYGTWTLSVSMLF